MLDEQKRQQAIHENNVLRKENEKLRKQIVAVEIKSKQVYSAAAEAFSNQQKMKRAFLRMLQTGEIERVFAIGGWANVRETLKAEGGFDGLSQQDIDMSF